MLAALRANGNTKTRIVTLDLDEPLALDMAKGGNTFALIADKAYELGRAMAKSAAYGLLGKKAPRVRRRAGDDDHEVEPRRTGTASRFTETPPASVMNALGK